jgi:hypothetical protein
MRVTRKKMSRWRVEERREGRRNKQQGRRSKKREEKKRRRKNDREHAGTEGSKSSERNKPTNTQNARVYLVNSALTSAPMANKPLDAFKHRSTCWLAPGGREERGRYARMRACGCGWWAHREAHTTSTRGFKREFERERVRESRERESSRESSREQREREFERECERAEREREFEREFESSRESRETAREKKSRE